MSSFRQARTNFENKNFANCTFWFVGGDDLTGTLRVLQLQMLQPSQASLAVKLVYFISLLEQVDALWITSVYI